MVATNSSMLPIKTKASLFRLEDVRTGKMIELHKAYQTKGYLIAFICNHCPFVIHILDHIVPQFNKMNNEGIQIFAISSNDIKKYPEDTPEKMRELAEKYQFNFPYLFDRSQKVAKSFSAACTPDFFLFNENLELFYRGRYDDSRPNSNSQVTGIDLLNAVKSLQNGKEPPIDQLPSIGCNIKWKPGNEPKYFER